tara:strand:- start:1443 stop:2294 length:852 start_codon:yes stop_codon:yes gene_type:complete
MITFDDLVQPYLPSGRLWKGFTPPLSMGPMGGTCITQSGNPAFGFFDNFHAFQASSLEGPYLLLEGTGCTVEQIADTATEKGLVQLALDGNAENDEAVLQWGRGLGAPFKLADHDLVFEARLSVSQVTAAKYSLAVGLGEVGMGATDALFVDSTQALADKNFVGFVSLNAEGAALDAAYKADGQTYQDGATKTKLDSLHTMVASTYFKVGFRFRAHPKKVEFYVDNALPGGNITPARLTTAEIDAATFPDDVMLAPIIGAKDAAGDTALNVKLDWWACAQLLG